MWFIEISFNIEHAPSEKDMCSKLSNPLATNFLNWLVYKCLACEARGKSLGYRTIILYGNSFKALCSVSFGTCTPLELNCNIFIFPFRSAPNRPFEIFALLFAVFWGTCHSWCRIYITKFCFLFPITHTLHTSV